MSVLVMLDRKCTLATSPAVFGESRYVRSTGQTDGQTDGGWTVTLHYSFCKTRPA